MSAPSKDISAIDLGAIAALETTGVGPDEVNHTIMGNALQTSGATGTRLVLTMLRELRRRKGRYGLATACIGGGQGIAMICERV